MSLPLWTQDEIAAATGARIVGRLKRRDRRLDRHPHA